MRCSNSRRVGFCQFVVQLSGRSQTSGYRLWELSSKLFYMSHGYFPGWHLQVHFYLWPGPPVSKRSPLYPHISFQVTSESLGKWLSPKSGVYVPKYFGTSVRWYIFAYPCTFVSRSCIYKISSQNHCLCLSLFLMRMYSLVEPDAKSLTFISHVCNRQTITCVVRVSAWMFHP